jgi:hypothetical protein
MEVKGEDLGTGLMRRYSNPEVKARLARLDLG